MGTVISILIIIVCILLILVVLVQNSKGGGLASSFASSNQVMGVRKTADFLEKATWTLAIALLALSILSTSYNSTGGVTKGTESVTRQRTEAGTDAETAEPAAPATNTAPPATNTAPPAPVPPAGGQ